MCQLSFHHPTCIVKAEQADVSHGLSDDNREPLVTSQTWGCEGSGLNPTLNPHPMVQGGMPGCTAHTLQLHQSNLLCRNSDLQASAAAPNLTQLTNP